jgi:peptide/nickel transport system substrate-binding protein
MLGASAWLIACGGGDDDGGQSSSTGGAATQTAASAGQPKRGGTISLRITGTPPLDPFANSTFQAQRQAGFVYSRLLKFKTGPTPDTAFNYGTVPDLAQSVETNSGAGMLLQ